MPKPRLFFIKTTLHAKRRLKGDLFGNRDVITTQVAYRRPCSLHCFPIHSCLLLVWRLLLLRSVKILRKHFLGFLQPPFPHVINRNHLERPPSLSKHLYCWHSTAQSYSLWPFYETTVRLVFIKMWSNEIEMVLPIKASLNRISYKQILLNHFNKIIFPHPQPPL